MRDERVTPGGDDGGAMLPADAPLAMPEQDLSTAGTFAQMRPVPLTDQASGMLERRLFLVIGSALLGLVAGQEMAKPLVSDGTDLLDAVIILLLVGLFSWIAFGFLNAIAGFFVLLGTGPGMPRWIAHGRLPDKRTAVLLPIYNEDVDAVATRLGQMCGSIAAVGAEHLFDFFMLSDSGEEGEAAEWHAVCGINGGCDADIFYRRRMANVGRKPGNVADWLRQFGAAYEHMIVLDADSLMSGAAMVRLAATMEQNPRVGLIQTVPAIINGRTFFARWQQFSAIAYGSIASAGLQWWSGSESTFWGHNAIIRVRAFAQSCGLPMLPGREPFGGHILSHDMVEAALLRRAGWRVHMVMLPAGSYEEAPPTLIDHAIRDRRWCQGNLQHIRLIGARGFHWVNRLQLVMGASAYLTSPLWLLLMALGLIEPLRGHAPAFTTLPAGWLLVLTIVLLIGPKLVAFLWLCVDHDIRDALGGARRVISTVLIEIPLATFIAPITMLSQTMAIADIVRGRPSGWVAQRRDADGLAVRDAFITYRWHVAMGALFMLATLIGMHGALWTLPVAISLLASPFTAMLTSRSDIGDWLAARGLFLSPQDVRVVSGPVDPANLTAGHGRYGFPERRFVRVRRGPTLNP